MAVKNRVDLKSYFGRGMYPTAEQFGDLIDSLRHCNERISMVDVDGLARALNSKGDSAELKSLQRAVETLAATGVLTTGGAPFYRVDVVVRTPSGGGVIELPEPDEFAAKGGEIVVAVDYDGNVRYTGMVLAKYVPDDCVLEQLPLAEEDVVGDMVAPADNDGRLVFREGQWCLRPGLVFVGTEFGGGRGFVFVSDGNGCLRCLADMESLQYLAGRFYELERRYEEDMPTALSAADGVLNLGVVESESVAWSLAAERKVTENPAVREIRWRTSDEPQRGAGGTIFQSVHGNWYVVQTVLFGGGLSRCMVRTITTGGNYQVGPWQELVLPVRFEYNMASRVVSAQHMAMTTGFPGADSRKKALFTLPLASLSVAGLMSSADWKLLHETLPEASDSARHAFFDDYWTASGGEVDRVGHPEAPYGLNGLWLTYEEAVAVAADTQYHVAGVTSRTIKGRTNFEPPTKHAAEVLVNFQAPNAEVLNVGLFSLASTFGGWLSNAPKLVSIIGEIHLTYFNGGMNNSLKCPKLAEVKFYGLKRDFDIRYLAAISPESVTYLVNNAANGEAIITVTVHPDVYAKLTDEANADWFGLLTAAAERNIMFAVAG